MTDSPASSPASTVPTEPTPPLTPRQIFDRMLRGWLHGGAAQDAADDLLAADAVVEVPFAPPGHPRRFTSREEFLAMARPGRAALPVRFDAAPDVLIHDTTDPEVIVVEYALTGTITTTNEAASAAFIGVLRTRDGKITLWREYQDTAAIAAALSQAAPPPTPPPNSTPDSATASTSA